MAEIQSQAERAFGHVIEWLEHFEELEGPRQSGKVAYPLDEMLLRCLLAVLERDEEKPAPAKAGAGGNQGTLSEPLR